MTLTPLERAAVEYVKARDAEEVAWSDTSIGDGSEWRAAWHAAQKRKRDALEQLNQLVRERLAAAHDAESEFEVVVTPPGDRDPFVAASVSGPRDQVHREALGYAEQYRCEGSVTVHEVTRTMVARMAATKEDAT